MHEHIYIHAYIHTYIQVRDKERNTLVHAAARGGLPALAMDLVDMLGADAIGLQNAQGESALDVASGAGVGMALMRRAPAEVLRTMDMTRVPWLHQKLRTILVPLLLNDASVTSVDLKGKSVSGGRARLYFLKYPQSPLPKHAQRIHADMRPAHPPVLCPRQTLKSPLAPGGMLR